MVPVSNISFTHVSTLGINLGIRKPVCLLVCSQLSNIFEYSQILDFWNDNNHCGGVLDNN